MQCVVADREIARRKARQVQSETMVASMVDHFVVLTLPNSGDELQGIKKGVLELADVLAVNKADGDNVPAARRALRELEAAMRYLRPRHSEWPVRAQMVFCAGRPLPY